MKRKALIEEKINARLAKLEKAYMDASREFQVTLAGRSEDIGKLAEPRVSVWILALLPPLTWIPVRTWKSA